METFDFLVIRYDQTRYDLLNVVARLVNAYKYDLNTLFSTGGRDIFIYAGIESVDELWNLYGRSNKFAFVRGEEIIPYNIEHWAWTVGFKCKPTSDVAKFIATEWKGSIVVSHEDEIRDGKKIHYVNLK
jgi:hypothetical protein